MVTAERAEEVSLVVRTVTRWAAEQVDVRAVVLVGSWARNAGRMDSDVDLIVLTDNATHAEPDRWATLLHGTVVRVQQWGPLHEVRVRRPSTLEVEMGIAPLSWAATTPVDSGTYKVMHDGHRIVYDLDGTAAALSEACRR